MTIRLLLLATLCSFAPLAAASAALPAVGASPGQSSVSGISSGGFMAAQFHVAYSAELVGVGIVAGGPYYCAGSDTPASFGSAQPYLATATTTCMNPCRWAFWPFVSWCERLLLPDGAALADKARNFAAAGKIDPLHHLADDRIYLFSGGLDDTVVTGVVDQAQAFYRAAGIPPSAMTYAKLADAQHAYISDEAEHACDYHGAPYLNDCNGYDQAREILQQLYGPLQPNAATPDGNLLAFDQHAFVAEADVERSGLAETAYVYLPNACDSEPCRVHVAFHGCKQSAAEYATNQVYFHQLAGYNEVADSNHIIVLYPQIRARNEMLLAPFNPNGCWDFWGYSGSDFYTKKAVQMGAVAAMIERLSGAR